jgi:hypothetical protein
MYNIFCDVWTELYKNLGCVYYDSVKYEPG